MRILMLGAGAVGGYFGARIHQAGGDVTFLTRPSRANYLVANGLHVHSPLGNIHITPKIITSAKDCAVGKFDVVILSCKAYDLDSAIDAFASVLEPQGVVIPMLNGFAHLDKLDTQFGREKVLGGFAHLGVMMAPEGEIRHLNDFHRMVIGCRTKSISPFIHFLVELLARSGIDFSLSKNIESEMWDKFIFLSTLVGATCTMRSTIGEILHTHSGKEFILGLFDECVAIAKKFGHTPDQESLTSYRNQLIIRDSLSTASMLRDIEQNRKTEADHIIGDMIRRAEAVGVDTPILKIAYSHLQAYEIRRHHQ